MNTTTADDGLAIARAIPEPFGTVTDRPGESAR
jgi:hypothetical protein